MAKDILTRVPDEYDMSKIKRNFGLAVTPTVVVLFQELERMNKLINRIRRTLKDLRKVMGQNLFLFLSL